MANNEETFNEIERRVDEQNAERRRLMNEKDRARRAHADAIRAEAMAKLIPMFVFLQQQIPGTPLDTHSRLIMDIFEDHLRSKYPAEFKTFTYTDDEFHFIVGKLLELYETAKKDIKNKEIQDLLTTITDKISKAGGRRRTRRHKRKAKKTRKSRSHSRR